MRKTTDKFAPEVRQRAIYMVLDHERDYPSRWTTVVSIAEKIGCSPPTLHEWVKKIEVDSGKRAGVPTEMADRLKALEQAIHDSRPAHRGGLIQHSDRGSQYVSIKYTERLAEAGIEPSVGSVGGIKISN